MRYRGRLAAMLLAGAATAATIAGGGAPAQASEFVRMNIWNSSHCLDNDTGNDAKLQMWNCTGHAEQHWNQVFDPLSGAYGFSNQNTGRCVSAPADAGTVTMVRCNPGLASQQWRAFAVGNEAPGGSYIVWYNVLSGLCLTTPSVGNGTLVQTTVCDPNDQYDRWHAQ